MTTYTVEVEYNTTPNSPCCSGESKTKISGCSSLEDGLAKARKKTGDAVNFIKASIVDSTKEEAHSVETASQVYSVKFGVGDYVLLEAKSKKGEELLNYRGKIWKVQPFGAAERWFMTPLEPGKQGEFKGTAKGKTKETWPLFKDPTIEKDFVVIAMVSGIDNFSWRNFKEYLD